MSDPAGSEAQVFSLDEQRAARDARFASSPVASGRPRCAATTASGARCRNYAVDHGRCRVHAPAAAEGEEARPRTAPRRPPGLAGGTVRPRAGVGQPRPDTSHAHVGERQESVPVGTGPQDGSARTSRPRASRAPGARDEAPTSTAGAPRRAGDPGGPRPGSFAWANAQLLQRGYGSAIDGLELLRDAADDRFLEALRGLVGFLRRRVTGAYEIDEFGFDEDLTTQVLMPLLRPMHRHYWRVTSHGIEHVPEQGGALLVANHAGTLPADALITRLDVFDLTGRHARELGADLVFRTPFVGELARKTGATLAAGDDADRLLSSGELVAVWPEGFKGLGKPWRDRYKLQRFGRGGFVATASRAQVPIIPTAIVGSEEIYPMLFDLRIVARLLGFPYFPVVAQMFALPVLGPFALLPLPSKWIIEYGEPIDTASFGSELSEDPMALFDLTDQVRERIQQMLHRNLMGRRSVFL